MGRLSFRNSPLHFSGLSRGEVNAPVSLSDDPFVLTGRPITPAGRIGPTSAGAAQKRVCVWADSPLDFLTCPHGGRAPRSRELRRVPFSVDKSCESCSPRNWKLHPRSEKLHRRVSRHFHPRMLYEYGTVTGRSCRRRSTARKSGSNGAGSVSVMSPVNPRPTAGASLKPCPLNPDAR